MSNALADLATLEALVAPVCLAQGVELVSVHLGAEPGGAVLRVLIELPNAESLPKGVGVTLDDCSRVSRELSRVLDERDERGAGAPMPGTYRLEVSSPGIERPLVKPRDYERYAGREVKVGTRAPIAERRNFTGILLGLHEDRVRLRVDKGQELDIPIREITKAHLVFRF